MSNASLGTNEGALRVTKTKSDPSRAGTQKVALPDLGGAVKQDLSSVVLQEGRQSRATVVGNDVKNAWMTRGWTLSQAIEKYCDEDVQETHQGMGSGEVVGQNLEEAVRARQLRLEMISEVNKHLQTALVNKKLKEEQLRNKMDALVERLTAACAVEKRARETAEAALEEQILTEERDKQDMQLALSQDIRMREESIAQVRAANEALVEANAQNKKFMKEQQVEIKERQKAIRHLDRQIHVLEGARKDAQEKDDDAPTSHEEGMPTPHKRSSGIEDDGDSVLKGQREKASASHDSKGLLRGAQAEKYLEDEKRRIQAHKLETQDTLDRGAARTMEEIKNLPGLDLNKLLGIAPSVPSQNSHHVQVDPTK